VEFIKTDKESLKQWVEFINLMKIQKKLRRMYKNWYSISKNLLEFINLTKISKNWVEFIRTDIESLKKWVIFIKNYIESLKTEYNI
jgi:hypothetical protein